MKVLEKGRKQNGWAKELKCSGFRNGYNGCDALLLVEESDVKYTGSKHSYGDTYPDHFYGFVCPECGTVTDYDDFPNRITKNIEKVVDPSIKKKIGS